MTIETATTFKFAQNMLPKLVKRLLTISKVRKQQLDLISDTFGDPLLWAPYYIEPYCQQFNPADYDDESRHLVRELLTSRLQHFLGGEKHVQSPHLLILADAGMGKTSCLVMLKLAHLNSFWPPSYDVELLKLGTETLSKIKGLEKKRTVLLLDALDEDPLAWGRVDKRLTEILTATKGFQRVIITCRTQFFSLTDDYFERRGLVEVGGYSCPAIFMSLFDEIQVNSFLEKRFPGQITRQNQAAKIIMSMHSLKFRPMLLSHIEELLESKTKKWTMHTLYYALVQAWLHRERKKMSETRKADDVPELKDLYRACVSLARLMFQKNSRTVSITQIDNAFTFDSEIGHLNKMDIAGRSLLNKNSEGEFRFSHYSIQEFLFAQAIFQGRITVHKKSEYRPTVQVMQFLDLQIRTASEEIRRNIRLDFLNLNGLQLKDVDLSALDLSGMIINECSISHSQGIATTFKETEFIHSKLNDVDLRLADLSSGQIRDTTLRTCFLNSSIAEKLSMSRVTFDAVDLQSANLTNAQIRDSNLRNCLFNSSIAEKLLISKTKLESSDFSNCNLSAAKISDSTLLTSKLNSAQAEEIYINGCTFDAVDFNECDFRNAKISDSKFKNSKLNKIILNGAKLQNISFVNCFLTNIELDVAIFINCQFIDCDMSGTIVSDRTKATNTFKETKP